MAILWAVEMESEDYKTGLHCGGRAKTERGKKKQREKASKTIESAEGWRMEGANANNANEIAPRSPSLSALPFVRSLGPAATRHARA